MFRGNRVIVYRLQREEAQYNRLNASVHDYDPLTNSFRVNLDDGRRLTLDSGNVFMHSLHRQYFSTPFEELPLLTEAAHVRYTSFRPQLVATERIRAGKVFGVPSARFTLTQEQVDAIEAAFTAFMSTNMSMLAGDTTPYPVQLERRYNAVMPFVGVLAQKEVWGGSMVGSLSQYDPISRECLRDLWHRTNGLNVLWLAFWCRELRHLAPFRVFHIWHFALTFAYPAADRRTVIVSQMLGSMQNPPARLL